MRTRDRDHNRYTGLLPADRGQQHRLLSHGTVFYLPSADHLRVVFLAEVRVLEDAIARLGRFLADYKQ